MKNPSRQKTHCVEFHAYITPTLRSFDKRVLHLRASKKLRFAAEVKAIIRRFSSNTIEKSKLCGEIIKLARRSARVCIKWKLIKRELNFIFREIDPPGCFELKWVLFKVKRLVPFIVWIKYLQLIWKPLTGINENFWLHRNPTEKLSTFSAI